MSIRRNLALIWGMVMVASALLSGCAAPVVEHQRQSYAKYSDTRTLEYGMPQVWKAIEATLRNHKIVDRTPTEVDVIEMKTLKRRTIETDWINSQSRNRYVNYTVNGAVRRKELQTRHKFVVLAESVLGGVKLTVSMREENEMLRQDGTSGGWEASEDVDSSRINDLLSQIQNQVLAAAP